MNLQKHRRQSLPGQRKCIMCTLKHGPTGGFGARRLAGLSLAVIIDTEGVEGKETKLNPSCTLINMQEVILLFDCINLP